MLVSDYNYDLPEERIAKFPPEERGSSRLLVLDRNTGDIIDSRYRDLDEFLNPGDVLILNDTRVMQSRLFCTLPDGRSRELVVLEKHSTEPQRVMYRGKLHEGDILIASGKGLDNNSFEEHNRRRGDYGATEPRNDSCRSRADETLAFRIEATPDGRPLVDGSEGAFRERIIVKRLMGNGIAEVASEVPLADLAEKYGTVPLPPYLHRDATESDKKRYQTVWAKHMGSAAAPTASLNMTDDLLNRLQQKGVIIKYLTLHVGLGTFLPIRSDKIEDHKMHSEWFNIPSDTIAAITKAKNADAGGQDYFSEGGPERDSARSSAGRPWRRAGRTRPEEKWSGQAPHPRVIALGTTVARTLEYYGKTGKTSGEDDIFIYPGFDFQVIDGLITNYHAPKSTVLMLASAFAGWDHLKAAYEHAIAEKYNFLSYGDSMFIC